MKRLFLNLIIVISAVSLSSCGYNSMVEKQEAVESQWAQVQNVYQRRMDLIPNLVETVKGVANFEKGTLEAVVQARAEATKTTINANDLTPEKVAQFQKAQEGLTGALSKFMSIVENYPDLKANQNFTELQAQLEGTENRITVERMKFNESVKDYNTYIRQFPNNMTSGMFGFQKKGYFEASAGADKAPSVKF
ncbi:MAG TPA: LemA family protein [Cytophagaceae bacterium]|jgi:LemA protein|nr:LemA family protein [Cytophagaceae bacterium]